MVKYPGIPIFFGVSRKTGYWSKLLTLLYFTEWNSVKLFLLHCRVPDFGSGNSPLTRSVVKPIGRKEDRTTRVEILMIPHFLFKLLCYRRGFSKVFVQMYLF